MPLCPNCGEDNPARARFCLACAQALGDTPGPERTERKFAAALFADLVGSTALAEREDPEVVRAVVSRTFDRLAEEVERFGGVLEKFMGDAILAVFGVPTAHEDDPERAVRAAIEMQALLGELNRTFAAESKPTLEMRIGVEAGDVLVDLARVAGPRERMLTGDAVNVAARLQAAANPWQIVVGPAVYAATKDVIDYRELDPLTLKGKTRPVPAWQALRVKMRRRGERPALGLEARLIGRDEELELLRQTFHRVESEGRPNLVTVLGPAGVGKSRLTSELLRYLDSLPTLAYWRKGRCLAYGNVSYSALAEAVKAQCEILEDDPPDIAEEKIRGAVEELVGDDSIVPQIRALVGTAAGTFSREELFDAWRRFFERMAARLPIVLVLEDIHWADAGLLDFIEYMADWAQGPILVLTLARPELLELRPAWGGGKRNYSAIYLDQLAPEESNAMLEDLLGGPLSDDLRRLITERTEGNPLFTEEVVRMFIDQGILRATEASRLELARPVEQVDVPHSIHALIATRIDGLPSDEKGLLQDAAVVGRAFWAGVLTRLSERDPEDVRKMLGRLRVKEIIVPREPPIFSGELEFAFRHVLIRDVAYESLPKTLRAEKHIEVARWAEAHAAGGDELAEVTAAHYLRAIEYQRELGGPADRGVEVAACRWAWLAGDRALRLWQQAEALRWYRGSLDLAERLDLPVEEQAKLSEATAMAAGGLADFAEVGSLLRGARERYEAMGDEVSVGRVEARLAWAAFELGDEEAVQPWAESAIARLQPMGDGPDLARTLDFLGNYYRRRGRLAEAEPMLRDAVEMASRLGAKATEGQARASLASAVIHRGSVREGVALAEQAFAIAKDAGDLDLSLRAHNALASILMDYAPDYERGWSVLWEGIELSKRSGRRDYEGWLWQNVGNYGYDQGKLPEIELAARMGHEIGESLSYAHVVIGALYYDALLAFLRGDLEDAEQTLVSQEASVFATREIQAIPYRYLLRAEIALAKGRHEEAIRVDREGLDKIPNDLMLGMADELVFHLVRTLVLAGRTDETDEPLATLRRVAEDRPNSEAFFAWGEGLVEAEPEAAEKRLRAAIDTFRTLARPIDEARCLLDLSHLLRAAGTDASAEEERARTLLAGCDVTVFSANGE